MKEIKDFCPICEFKAEIIQGPHNDYVDIGCPKCGNYQTSNYAVYSSELFKNDDKKPVLSHWIRKNQKIGERLKINADIINKIIGEYELPNLIEQTENFIRLIGDSVKKPDEFYINQYHYIASIIGSYDGSGVRYIADHLFKTGIVKAMVDSGNDLQVYLTYPGWEYYDKIKEISLDSRVTFMAMKYNDETLEKIYKEHLKPAVKNTGFELRKLDERLRAGLIDDQLRIEIRKSRFLLADLTHGNYGSYWEAGYAEGLGKPVIYLCQKKIFDEKKTHFDTNHLTTITWELETIVTDMKKLKATIRTTFPLDAKMEDE